MKNTSKPFYGKRTKKKIVEEFEYSASMIVIFVRKIVHLNDCNEKLQA